MGVVTWNRGVECHRHHIIGIDPVVAIYSAIVRILNHMAVEFNLVQYFWTGKFPGIAITQPVIGMLYLFAVFDALSKHAILITDAIAIARKVECRHGIKEAGGKPP